MFVIGQQLPGPDGSDRSRRWLLLQGVGSLLLLGLVTTHFYVVNFLLPTQGIMRSVVCVDATTGQLLWEQGFQTNRHERIHRKNSHATPTPVTDGRSVYAYFGDAGLLCVDFDGQQLWLNRDLPYRDKYGAASSPVLGQGLVFLSCIDLEDPYIAAIDQKTGVERWRHRMQLEKLVGSYAAPWYGMIQGRPQLVINGGRRLMGLDPESGHVLWQHVHEVGEVIPSPVVTGNTIVGGGDRRLVVYGMPQEYLVGNEPVAQWETSKGAPFHCSTLSDGVMLYTLTDEGVLTCFALESGEIEWRQRLHGAFTSSPILVGQMMYLINRDGATTVLDISQRGKIIATNELGELCESSIAVAGGRVYIRLEQNLVCIGKSGTPLTTPEPRPMEDPPQTSDKVANTQ